MESDSSASLDLDDVSPTSPLATDDLVAALSVSGGQQFPKEVSAILEGLHVFWCYRTSCDQHKADSFSSQGTYKLSMEETMLAC